MSFIIFILAIIAGASLGRFMVHVIQNLPPILLDDDNQEKMPRDLIDTFTYTTSCTSCKHSLNYIESLPIIGYLFMSGKCPVCHASPMPLRDYLVTCGVSLLFGLTVIFFPVTLATFFVLLTSCLLICCYFTDLDHRILPNEFTLSLVWIGLIGSLAPVFITSNEAIIGAVFGYGMFWLINELYRYFRQLNGMFPGDFKLNAGIGACLGIHWLIPTLIIALFFIIICTLGELLWNKKLHDTSDLHKELAYSCYVSIVAIVALYLKLYLSIVET